jgi:GNAT superfamily N-acetyltransferase
VTIVVRALAESDLPAGDRIFRLAFGTQFGLAEPMTFRGDASLIEPRWRADPAGALGAFVGSQLVGSSFAVRWGTSGVLGPLTVHPDHWSRGVGKALLEPTIQLFETWKLRQVALFTLPESTKHVPLYQKFGFWPQFLTALMSKPVGPGREHAPHGLYSGLDASDRHASLKGCAEVTGSIFGGLDLRLEVEAIDRHSLGDTILLQEGDRIEGFAACHIGPGTEAGSGALYVKFGAVRPGVDAEERFARLVAACEALAAQRKCAVVLAGINTARIAAYRHLLDQGFRTFRHGVAMQRPNTPGYNTAAYFVIDDWR